MKSLNCKYRYSDHDENQKRNIDAMSKAAQLTTETATFLTDNSRYFGLPPSSSRRH
jgi:hypothetical protein